MNNIDPSTGQEADPWTRPALPSSLNVLTILTITGCSFFTLMLLATPSLLKFSKKMIDSSKVEDLSPEKIIEMQKARQVIELTENNLIPLMLIGGVGIILCFWGALQMRKLKKDGYWIYVAGQILPLLGGLLIVGTAQYSGITSFFMPVISVVFIILYTTQRKYLVY